MNVEPTAEIIDEMAETLEQRAAELKRLSARMREKQDVEYAAEAVNSITNMIMNLRLDLLVVRPIREFRRELEKRNGNTTGHEQVQR